MRSVAVLSDIHGVLPVLEAVLAEPAVAGADLIVVTGDHASGPQPSAVLDRLAALGDRVLLVRGNADRELVSLARGEDIDIPDEVTPWAASQLTEAHVEMLAGLPHPITVDIDGFGPVLFCHGTPRDDEEVVLVDTRLARWAEVFADVPAEVATIVCGHTHMPFVRMVDRRLVINAGSIGMPYGRPGGHWALLEDGAVTLHRTPIDIDAAIASVVADSTYPGRQAWADYFLGAASGDVEALTAFAPRDGRAGDIPLTEFDPADGVLAPTPPRTSEPLAPAAVLCFFPEVLRQWEEDGLLRPIGFFSEEVGGATIYLHQPEGSPPVAVFHPGMGGPLAAHCLEKAIAGGVRRVVVVGGAGAVSEQFDRDEVLVVDEAVRDEGTSHHYLSAARSVRLDRGQVAEAVRVLTALDLPHRVGKVWTTDADFRETRQKVDARVREGCLAVEMEAASLAAVCAFRDVPYGHLVYSGDALHEGAWDGRGWTSSDRRGQLLEVAVSIAST